MSEQLGLDPGTASCSQPLRQTFHILSVTAESSTIGCDANQALRCVGEHNGPSLGYIHLDGICWAVQANENCVLEVGLIGSGDWSRQRIQS